MMSAGPSYERWALALSAACAAASVAVLGARVWFAQPLGDDFIMAAHARQGVVADVVRAYGANTGRWLTRGLRLWVAGQIDLFRDYSVILAGLLVLRFAAAYALARSVLAAPLSRLRCAIYAGCFCLLYWCAMPATGDSLFWLNGAIEYELAATGLLVLLAGLWSKPLTGVRAAAIGAGAILLAGMHELIGLTLCLVTAAGWFLVHRERRPRRWWLMLGCAAVAGLLLVVLAPGNFVRREEMGVAPEPLRAAVLTAGHLAAWVPRWLLDAQVLLAAFAVIADPHLRLREELRKPALRAMIPALGAMSLAAGFGALSWATNGVVPGRVLDWLFFVFLLTVVASVLLVKPEAPPAWAGLRGRSLLLAAFFLSLFAAGNPWLGAADLALRVPKWATARRTALMALKPQSGQDATLPPLPEFPQLYFDFDVCDHREDGVNRKAAAYFGVRSLSGGRPRREPRGAALSGRTYGLYRRE